MTEPRVNAQEGGGLSITEQHVNRAARLSVSGEIDVANGTQLRRKLAVSISDSTNDQVIVDMRQVTFMSSTGIAALVDAHWQADQYGKPLHVIVGDNRTVTHPLRLAGVDAVLSLHATADFE